MNNKLIIFGGLPGVGKTTIAKSLSKSINAFYIRVDSIESAIYESSLKPSDDFDSGYLAAYEIAKENLKIGHSVIADSVNCIPITRNAWRNVAISTGASFVEIEIICSCKETHKNRVESRKSDYSKKLSPSWEDIVNRKYFQWDLNGIQIDSSKYNKDQCVVKIVNYLNSI
jgi:predicted kinase